MGVEITVDSRRGTDDLKSPNLVWLLCVIPEYRSKF
jgi:hypothetical protein